MPDKFLTEDGWKAVVTRFKLKDKELQKALFMYEEQLDDDYEYRLKYLGKITTLAANLKKDKEVAGNAEVVKYLSGMLAAIETEKRQIAKDKAEAAKDTKKDAATAPGDAKGDDGPKNDAVQEEFGAKLLAAIQKLKSSGDAAYEFAVCDAKPCPGVTVAKEITAKHRDELCKITGGRRIINTGTCQFEDGKLKFVPETPASGLAKKLQDSIKHFTGKQFPVIVGSESADDDGGDTASASATAAQPASADQPGVAPGGHHKPGASDAPGEPPSAKDQPATASGPVKLTGSVGRGGKNKPEDVKAVQAALNNRAKAGLVVDGKCGSKTIAAIAAFQKAMGMAHPDGLVEPGKQTLDALNGAKVPAGDKAGAEPAAPGGTAKAASDDSSAAIEAAAKAVKEIADRDKQLLQSCSGWVKKITDMLVDMTDVEAMADGTKIRDLLKKNAVEVHNGPVTQVKAAAAKLAAQKDPRLADEVKQAVEKAKNGFKVLDDLTDNAMEWMVTNSHPTAAPSEHHHPGAGKPS